MASTLLPTEILFQIIEERLYLVEPEEADWSVALDLRRVSKFFDKTILQVLYGQRDLCYDPFGRFPSARLSFEHRCHYVAVRSQVPSMREHTAKIAVDMIVDKLTSLSTAEEQSLRSAVIEILVHWHNQPSVRLLDSYSSVSLEPELMLDASLVVSAYMGDVDLFQRLYLDSIPSSHEAYLWVGSPLYAACIAGNISIVKQLLADSAHLQISDGKIGSPLAAAACRGHWEIVKLLLDHGVDANWQSPNKEGIQLPALVAAAGCGHLRIVKLLISRGADLNLTGKQRPFPLSALACALRNGHEKTAVCILEAGASVTPIHEEDPPIVLAAENRCLDVVQLLLGKGENIDAHQDCRRTALVAAAYGGHHQIVQYLLQQGADVNHQGVIYGSPLLAASANGHHDIAKLLLERGASVKSQISYSVGWKIARSPLAAAVMYGHRQLVELLLQSGASLDDSNVWSDHVLFTPLAIAAIRGEEAIAQLLVENGADVEKSANWDDSDFDECHMDENYNFEASTFKSSPAQLALNHGHYSLRDLLVELGAKAPQQQKPIAWSRYWDILYEEHPRGP